MKTIIFMAATVLVLTFSACTDNMVKMQPVSLDAGVTVVVDQGPEFQADAGLDILGEFISLDNPPSFINEDACVE